MPTNESRSTGFYAPGVLDEKQWFRVAARDYMELIEGCDFARALTGVGTVFDVGCGLGKFPSLLAPHLAARVDDIECDFLDPSSHCVGEFRKSAVPPFVARHEFVSGIEDFEPEPGRCYDLVWALQSIYAWDRARLSESLAKVKALAGETGQILVYQAASQAFYHQFHDAYRAAFAGDTPPYITAEEVYGALGEGGFETRVFSFDHVIRVRDRALLEAYLRQLCFDPGKTLSDFERGPTGALLERHIEGQDYRFPQEVWLIASAPLMDRLRP